MVLIESKSSLSSLQMGYFHRADFLQAGECHKEKTYFSICSLSPIAKRTLHAAVTEMLQAGQSHKVCIPSEGANSSADCAVWHLSAVEFLPQLKVLGEEQGDI